MKHNRFYKNLVRFIIAVGIVLAVFNSMTWKDSIKNPNNSQYILECANALNLPIDSVSQLTFDLYYKTYNNHY